MNSLTSTLPNIRSSSCAMQTVTDLAYDPRNIEATEDLLSLSHREEGLALYEYARRCGGSILEIGAYCGYLSIFMAYGIKNREQQRRVGAEVFTIDTHKGVDERDIGHPDLFDRRQRGQPATFGRFVENCKNHDVWDIMHPIIDDSEKAHAHWRHGQCLGMLFIDGDHLHAKRDFRNFLPYVMPGGTICFHDYFWECPQVMFDIDTLVHNGEIEFIEQIHTMVIARKTQHMEDTYIS